MKKKKMRKKMNKKKNKKSQKQKNIRIEKKMVITIYVINVMKYRNYY